MKALSLYIFLTVVGFSLTGWGVDQCDPAKPNDCGAGLTCVRKTQIPNFSVGPGGSVTPESIQPITYYSCEKSDDAYSAKDCQALASTYGKDATTMAQKQSDSQIKSQDSINGLQEKIQAAQKELTETLNNSAEDLQKLTSNYRDATLKRQQDAQNNQLKLSDAIRQQNQQITDMNGKLAVAQIQANSAQNSYTAVVNANNISMVRMKCMSIIRKWMKDNAVGSTIRGSIGNTGSQQSLLNAQWDTCILTEQANAQVNISNAQAAITQAQANVSSLQTALAQANSSLAQMNASATQQNQMQQQANSNAATDYQQASANIQQKKQTAQQTSSQNIMSLNMQAMQISQRAPPNMNTELNSDLKQVQLNCCDNSQDPPAWKFNPSHLSDPGKGDDGEEGDDICTAQVSSTSANAKKQQDQQIMNTLPLLMQQSMGAH